MFEICLYMNIQIDFTHKGDIYKYILDNNKNISCQCFIYMCLYH